MIAALVAGPTLSRAEDASAGAVPEPQGYRLDEYRAPVPATLEGARVINAETARTFLNARSAVFIDVYPRPPKPENLPSGTIWRDPVHDSIEGAKWLPNVGYGVLAPAVETYFKDQLARLTGENRSKPIVFFCERDCWMSWNAAKRALSLGYKNVMWFSEGTNAWLEAGEDLARVEPEK